MSETDSPATLSPPLSPVSDSEPTQSQHPPTTKAAAKAVLEKTNILLRNHINDVRATFSDMKDLEIAYHNASRDPEQQDLTAKEVRTYFDLLTAKYKAFQESFDKDKVPLSVHFERADDNALRGEVLALVGQINAAKKGIEKFRRERWEIWGVGG
jgi:hypothetical protein